MQISIERGPDYLPGKWDVKFTLNNRTVTQHLTQGELLDLWLQITDLFDLGS